MGNKKMTKKERKEYFRNNYENYVYNAPNDPRNTPIFDSKADVYDMYNTWFPTNDINKYPPIRDYKNK